MIHVTVRHEFGGGRPGGMFGPPAPRGARPDGRRERDEDELADDAAEAREQQRAEAAAELAELHGQIEVLRNELHELGRLVRRLAEEERE